MTKLVVVILLLAGLFSGFVHSYNKHQDELRQKNIEGVNACIAAHGVLIYRSDGVATHCIVWTK